MTRIAVPIVLVLTRLGMPAPAAPEAGLTWAAAHDTPVTRIPGQPTEANPRARRQTLGTLRTLKAT